MKSAAIYKAEWFGLQRIILSRKNPEYGFTLIELLVALLLSAFLISATVDISIATKRTYNLKEDVARAQENANFAFETMRSVINLTEQISAASSSELTVSYKGGAEVVDCLGRPANTTSTTYLNRFFVNTTDKQLRCEVTTNPASTTETEPLIDKISAIALEYGVDTSNDGVVDSYTSTPANLNQIFSARVTLTLIITQNPLKTDNINFTIAMPKRILSKFAL